MVLRRAVIVLFFGLLLTAVVGAQTVSLTGKVIDPQGGVVVNATVTLTGSGAARPRAVRTTADGTFVLRRDPSRPLFRAGGARRGS